MLRKSPVEYKIRANDGSCIDCLLALPRETKILVIAFKSSSIKNSCSRIERYYLYRLSVLPHPIRSHCLHPWDLTENKKEKEANCAFQNDPDLSCWNKYIKYVIPPSILPLSFFHLSFDRIHRIVWYDISWSEVTASDIYRSHLHSKRQENQPIRK